MKVLYLTKYSRNGASSRLRSYQYFPCLSDKGIIVTVKPFFDEDYLSNLYSCKKISYLFLLKCYFKRFIVLFSIFKYDKIVIEKELFPYFFSWFEKILSLLNVKYIVDYDDAIFHNYDMSNNRLIRFFLANKIKNVIKYSDCVLAGNAYLASHSKKCGAKKIIIFPTVIDTTKYKVKEHKSGQNKIVIGWIGSPTSFKYVKNMSTVFSSLNQKYLFELQIVGSNEVLDYDGCVKYLDWTETSEAELVANFDIGIMPLGDTPWELGKCAYKLIQYMGCGLPVVASSVGMNKEVIDHGANGYLAENENDWVVKLGELIENAQMRKRFGENSRKKIEQYYSLQKHGVELTSLLKYGAN